MFMLDLPHLKFFDPQEWYLIYIYNFLALLRLTLNSTKQKHTINQWTPKFMVSGCSRDFHGISAVFFFENPSRFRAPFLHRSWINWLSSRRSWMAWKLRRTWEPEKATALWTKRRKGLGRYRCSYIYMYTHNYIQIHMDRYYLYIYILDQR